MIWCIVALCLIIEFSTVLHAESPYQEPGKPIPCDPGDGKFVAIGRTVLDFSDLTPLAVHGMSYNKTGEPHEPPQPGEDQGCYGNPYQVNALQRVDDIFAPKEHGWAHKPDGRFALKKPGYGPSGDSVRLLSLELAKHFPLDGWRADAYALFCSKEGARKESADDFEACIWPVASGADPATAAFIYRIDPKSFSTPDGGGLSFWCTQGAVLGVLSWCTAIFCVTQDVCADATFYPPAAGFGPETLGKVMAMADEISERVTARQVDYPWPN
jgi:hypothetical protein